jgi:hypothetical protein
MKLKLTPSLINTVAGAGGFGGGGALGGELLAVLFVIELGPRFSV